MSNDCSEWYKCLLIGHTRINLKIQSNALSWHLHFDKFLDVNTFFEVSTLRLFLNVFLWTFTNNLSKNKIPFLHHNFISARVYTVITFRIFQIFQVSYSFQGFNYIIHVCLYPDVFRNVDFHVFFFVLA